MKTEKERILDEVSQLRCEYEAIRRKTKELGNRTTRLYREIEKIVPDPSRKLTLNNGRKFS